MGGSQGGDMEVRGEKKNEFSLNYIVSTCLKKTKDWGQRDGSAVKSTCSHRGPGIKSQRPHGSSQPSITPVPSDAGTHSIRLVFLLVNMPESFQN